MDGTGLAFSEFIISIYYLVKEYTDNGEKLIVMLDVSCLYPNLCNTTLLWVLNSVFWKAVGQILGLLGKNHCVETAK